MPDFLVRDIPEPLMAKLKTKAADNGQSLQAEIRSILEDAVPMDRDEWFRQAAELSRHFKPGGPSAVELVRHGRDDRTRRIEAILRGALDNDDRDAT